MITKLAAGGVLIALLVSGCTDRDAEVRRGREESEAKARAEAARREMETLPEAFQTPDFFKKNPPKKKPEPSAETKPPQS